MARPLGSVRVKKPNISGIIQSIMLFIDCCCWLALGIIVIFCRAHMEPATSTGMTGVLSPKPRSSHRKPPWMGTAECTMGSQPYRFWERLTSCSG